MFSAPTAIRVLKKRDPLYLKKYDLSHLRHLFIAGEPLDEPTAKWIAECGVDEKGVVTVQPPLPPGCLSTHRLGTREIEEAVSSYPSIAEMAVVGVSDQMKAQVPLAFAVVKNPSQIETAEERKAMEKEDTFVC